MQDHRTSALSCIALAGLLIFGVLVTGSSLGKEDVWSPETATFVSTAGPENGGSLSSATIDDFNDGDHSSNPTWTVGAGGFSASAQFLETTAVGWGHIALARIDSTGDWSMRFNFPGAGDGVDAQLRVHLLSSAQNLASTQGYIVQLRTGSSSGLCIGWVDGGSSSMICNSNGYDKTPGWKELRINRTSGGTITVYLGGVQKQSYTDTKFSTSSYLGLRVNSPDSGHVVQVDDIVYNGPTTANPPDVTVSHPNGGETFIAQSTQKIWWNVTAGTNPLKANSTTIYYNPAVCGGPWGTPIATGQPTSGSWGWTLPAQTGSTGCVRVTTEDTQSIQGGDRSDAAFSIIAAAPPAVKLTRPNGGETLVAGSQESIAWTALAGGFPFGPTPISLHFSVNGSAGTFVQIAAGLGNNGNYTWTVPSFRSATVFVRVEARDDRPAPNLGVDASDAPFSIDLGNAAPQVSIVSPAAGSAIREMAQVGWDGADANNDQVTYLVKLSSDSGANWQILANLSFPERPTPQRRSVQLDTTKLPDGRSYRVRIEATDTNGSRTDAGSAADWTIDNEVPKSSMGALPAYSQSSSISLSWSGTDAVSGVESFAVYVAEDSGAFHPWLSKATNSTGIYLGQEGHKYSFFSVAVDKAGNRETKSASESATTIDSSPPVSSVKPLPQFTSSISFDLAYDIHDASPTRTTIHWRILTGAWDSVGPFTTSPAGITVPSDGMYEFYSIAEDDSGQKEIKSPLAEATTMVDTSPPGGSIDFPSRSVATLKPRVKLTATDGAELARVTVEYQPIDTAGWKTGFDHLALPGTKSFDKEVEVNLPRDGRYELRLVLKDRAGAQAELAGGELVADITPPRLLSPDPKTGARGVPIPAILDLRFSEPLQRPSIEGTLRIETGSIQSIEWLNDTAVRVAVTGITGNESYLLTLTSGIKDLLGNPMKEISLMIVTVPTSGSIVGSVKETGNGAAVRNAKIIALDDGRKEARSDRYGAFRMSNSSIGNRTFRVEAPGFIPAEFTVGVQGGQDNRVAFQLEKYLLPYAIGGLVAMVAAGVLLFLLLRWRKKAVNRRFNHPTAGQASPATERRARSPQIQPRGWVPTSAASERMLGGPTRCSTCRATVPAGEDFCPKCGQGVGGDPSGGLCDGCGGTVVKGLCISCGESPQGIEPAVPGRPEPKSAPDRVGGMAKEETAGMIDPPSPNASSTPGPLSACPACECMVPEKSTFCDVCGEPISPRRATS